jgi:hypothetical protein
LPQSLKIDRGENPLLKINKKTGESHTRKCCAGVRSHPQGNGLCQ